MGSRTKNALLVAGTVIALVGVIAAYILIDPHLFRPQPPGVGIEPGQLAPQFVIVDVNATSWDLSAHRGQVVLLDFMGVQCTTCVLEMSEGTMQGVHGRHAAEGFTILSIDIGGSLGTNNTLAAWRFIQGLNADGSRRWTAGDWPIALDNPGPGIQRTYRATALPLAYLVDRSGTIVWKHLGYVTQSDLEAQVVAALA